MIRFNTTTPLCMQAYESSKVSVEYIYSELAFVLLVYIATELVRQYSMHSKPILASSKAQAVPYDSFSLHFCEAIMQSYS